MADITLVYLNYKGRAEISRLILAYAGVRYTDERIEDIETIRGSLPYGQLPVLRYNGQMMAQSLSVARFLANQYGLGGMNSVQRAQADEIVDVTVDLMTEGFKARMEKDPEKKKEMAEKFQETKKTFFERLEKRLTERGGQFFVGNNLTWADLQLFCMHDIMNTLSPTSLDNYPKLAHLCQRISQIPNIKNWLENRPVTVM